MISTKALMTIKQLKLIDKVLLVAIHDECEKHGKCKLSDAELSWQFGCGLATITRSVKTLDVLGLVARTSVLTNKGYDRTLSTHNSAIEAYIYFNSAKKPNTKPKKQSLIKLTDVDDQLDILEGVDTDVNDKPNKLVSKSNRAADKAVIVKAVGGKLSSWLSV